MPVEHIFMGWDTPALPLAVDQLHARYRPSAGAWDLGGVVLVVPGRRAARRALELLAERGSGSALVPPTIVTLGQLPELLYQPHAPVADPLRALVTRAAVLRDVPADELRPIIAEPPGHEDWLRWIQLAEDLAHLDDMVAAGGKTIRDVARMLNEAGITPDTGRWELLCALRGRYEQALRSARMCDRNDARRRALAEDRCVTDRDLVLLAAADMVPVTASMIRSLGSQVISLVHAPRELSGAFDDIGCLIPDVWARRTVELNDERIHYVDRVGHYGHEVVAAVRRISSDPHRGPVTNRKPRGHDTAGTTADQVTIGLGDEADGPQVKRALEWAGCPARLARGESLRLTGPCSLLAGLGLFADQRRFDDFATLLRHPDVESYMRVTLEQFEDATAARLLAESTAAWLGLLDRYANDHLQNRVTEHWLGDPRTRTQLETLYRLVTDLLPDEPSQQRLLPHWSEPIAHALGKVYRAITLQADDPYGAAVAETIGAIGTALREQADLSSNAVTPEVTFSQAVAFTLDRLRDQTLAPPSGPAATELLGWLELHLDDADVMIVCGFNEGVIPSSGDTDPLLPDSAKRLLGLPDASHRYARDVYSLSALAASHPHLTLLAARRGDEDQPLAPSRLLLACPAKQAAARILRFYPPEGSREGRPYPLILRPAPQESFRIPTPKTGELPDKLSVTALGDYLACPYRFYLKHVLRLQTVTDLVAELDGLGFGQLAHEVLSRFGRSPAAADTDEKVIQRYLEDALHKSIAERFGPHPSPAVAVQAEQLRIRFHRFAQWQAQQVQEGWRVMAEHVESTFQRVINLSGGRTITLVGRIDRIDHHPEHGYQILDYKTGEKAKTPEKLHREGKGRAKRWVDFQLPMYRWLAETVLGDGSVTLGYLLLPKQSHDVGFAQAPWGTGEVTEGIDQAMAVVHRIAAGEFWPPGPPPRYDDGLAGICMDEYIERERAIALSTSVP